MDKKTSNKANMREGVKCLDGYRFLEIGEQRKEGDMLCDSLITPHKWVKFSSDWHNRVQDSQCYVGCRPLNNVQTNTTNTNVDNTSVVDKLLKLVNKNGNDGAEYKVENGKLLRKVSFWEEVK